MDRWAGLIRIPLRPNNGAHYKVAASLRLSPSSKTLAVPSANVVFFNGDRVEGTGDHVIERLSDSRTVAEILVSKFGGSVNAWVVDASTFNGPFAVYRDLVPTVDSRGDPRGYDPEGFPASTSVVSLLRKCVEEAKNEITGTEPLLLSTSYPPKTVLLGFSKGGTVLNQILTELAHLKPGSTEDSPRLQQVHIIPASKESFLLSISNIHYVDVGLNSPGAYLTDHAVIKKIAEHLASSACEIHFAIHGTPRQWCSRDRPWICKEKDRLVQLLQGESPRTDGRLQVSERLYFPDRPPSLQMHFEIIEHLNVTSRAVCDNVNSRKTG
ncbi:hypothetical protein QJS10_CPB20g01393 [Acorus calamus]|uniref:Uncharacterized protein n=1 Tax=Acorus calamus TaxID=4465 RepID=A0AAV9C703_ACOCL|nr:hypothetical protein QJS10_CPB20g01393 [Acorus calamus]